MRAQTTLDFAIGVTVFILVLIFVFLFLPGTLQPFTASAQEETAASDRIADLIVTDLLTADGQAYILDGECTARLMNDTSSPDCDFDGSTLDERLDLDDRLTVNLTMRAGTSNDVQCWTGTGVVPTSDSSCDTELVGGPAPPENTRSMVTARRIVRIEDTVLSLEVRMW